MDLHLKAYIALASYMVFIWPTYHPNNCLRLLISERLIIELFIIGLLIIGRLITCSM